MIVEGAQQMAPHPKQIAHDAVDRKESLRLGGGFEPPHLALPLARRLVGDFGPVVLVSIDHVAVLVDCTPKIVP